MSFNPTEFLPPAADWRGASEALMAQPNDPWITPAEAMQLTDTPDYAASLAYLARICAQCRFFKLEEFGQSAEGRALWMVIASKSETKTPAGLRADGRPIVLVQAGIHAGEIEGKDAGFMLLRDMAAGRKADLLDQVHLLFTPMVSPDGHERISRWNRPNQRGPVNMGWRTTAQNLNLNRDYTKADSPEMRAMISLLVQWQPSLFIDVHASDGIDHAYDLTYMFHGHGGTFAYSPRSARWLDQVLRPGLDADLRAAGHIPGPYLDPKDHRDLSRGFNRNHYGPRLSNGYGDLAHIPTVLIETHSLKPYRQRVLATYVFLETALRTAGQSAAELNSAVAADRAARPANLPVNWDLVGQTTPIDYDGIASETYESPASGTQEVRWLGRPRWHRNVPLTDDAPGAYLQRPKAYWVPASRADVIDRLRLHGIAMEPLAEARTLALEFLRLVNPRVAAQPFEGRQGVTTEVAPETQTATFSAGSVRVPTDQPLGDLAMVLLEPVAKDSFLAWGFFNQILQQTEYIEGYVIAPLAEQMLKSDPALQAAFAAKLNSDPAFAQDAETRLRWFYQRSPFFDQAFLRYPVGIER